MASSKVTVRNNSDALADFSKHRLRARDIMKIHHTQISREMLQHFLFLHLKKRTDKKTWTKGKDEAAVVDFGAGNGSALGDTMKTDQVTAVLEIEQQLSSISKGFKLSVGWIHRHLRDNQATPKMHFDILWLQHDLRRQLSLGGKHGVQGFTEKDTFQVGMSKNVLTHLVGSTLDLETFFGTVYSFLDIDAILSVQVMNGDVLRRLLYAGTEDIYRRGGPGINWQVNKSRGTKTEEDFAYPPKKHFTAQDKTKLQEILERNKDRLFRATGVAILDAPLFRPVSRTRWDEMKSTGTNGWEESDLLGKITVSVPGTSTEGGVREFLVFEEDLHAAAEKQGLTPVPESEFPHKGRLNLTASKFLHPFETTYSPDDMSAEAAKFRRSSALYAGCAFRKVRRSS